MLAGSSQSSKLSLLFLETQTPKQMKVPLLLGLILRFNSASINLIGIFFLRFFYFMKSFDVLTFCAEIFVWEVPWISPLNMSCFPIKGKHI